MKKKNRHWQRRVRREGEIGRSSVIKRTAQGKGGTPSIFKTEQKKSSERGFHRRTKGPWGEKRDHEAEKTTENTLKGEKKKKKLQKGGNRFLSRKSREIWGVFEKCGWSRPKKEKRQGGKKKKGGKNWGKGKRLGDYFTIKKLE